MFGEHPFMEAIFQVKEISDVECSFKYFFIYYFFLKHHLWLFLFLIFKNHKQQKNVILDWDASCELNEVEKKNLN